MANLSPAAGEMLAMRKLGLSLTLALLLVALGAIGVAGASAKLEVIDLNDPAVDAEDSAFLTAVCGFPVVAEASGHIIFHLDRSGHLVDLANYAIRERLTSEWGTFTIRDAGPDMFFLRDGALHVALVGRSITGSSVVGRVVVNIDTDEIVSVAGRLVGDEVLGDPFAPICRALSPS